MKRWHARAPLLIDEVLCRGRCDELRALFEANGARPRSYQGVVDPRVRECLFVRTDWRSLPELDELASCHIEPAFGIRVCVKADAPVMVYRYGEGVGFVPHHDEVTELELCRARTNEQPVLHGDITIVLFLNDGEDYGGGQLFFPNHHLSFKPRAGTALIFPARREFVHGVAPIDRGARFTCVARCFVESFD